MNRTIETNHREWKLHIFSSNSRRAIKEVLKKINLDAVTFKGYAFQICMKYAVLRHGYKAKEIPITFVDRVHGDSKMSTGIFKEAFFGVWKMRHMKL